MHKVVKTEMTLLLNNSHDYQIWLSVQFSHSVVSDSLRPHGLQHARPPCPSSTPRACSNSCPSSQWCHPTISSSVIPFSSCLQSFPASGAFQISQFFTSGGQSVGVSASAWVLPMNIQDWFPLGLTGVISLLFKGMHRWSPKSLHNFLNYIGRADAEAEVPILRPPDAKNWLIRKDPDAGKDWRQEEKGTPEDEMVGWHHWLDGHELKQALGVGDGQESLVCCSPWGHTVPHDWVTELNWTELKY